MTFIIIAYVIISMVAIVLLCVRVRAMEHLMLESQRRLFEADEALQVCASENPQPSKLERVLTRIINRTLKEAATNHRFVLPDTIDITWTRKGYSFIEIDNVTIQLPTLNQLMFDRTVSFNVGECNEN